MDADLIARLQQVPSNRWNIQTSRYDIPEREITVITFSTDLEGGNTISSDYGGMRDGRITLRNQLEGFSEDLRSDWKKENQVRVPGRLALLYDQLEEAHHVGRYLRKEEEQSAREPYYVNTH